VTDALKMDGDEVMVDIYESVQDELRMKNKQVMKERQKVGTEFGFSMIMLQPLTSDHLHSSIVSK